jgi:HSP20 family molecular chaperone IbpA
MSQVAIKKLDDGSKKTLGVFAEIAKRFEPVERRAFDLFERRGREQGHDVEDWINGEHELLGWPAAELSEKDGVYDVQIALPGFEAKEVEVTATPPETVLHAVSKQENKAEKDDVLWTEFGSSEIYRRFELANPINVDKVTANIENGLRRINAPEIARPKEVTAKAA